MLGIYVIPVVALCCSAHRCCAVDYEVACFAKRCTATATLIFPRTRLVAHQSTQQQQLNTPTNSLILRGLVVHEGMPKVYQTGLIGGLAIC